MSRQELHEIVDIVMDAREKWGGLELRIDSDVEFINWGNGKDKLYDYDYPTFSDFTKAVQDYIKTLES